MKTAYPKPNWHKTAIATDRGWVAPENNELLVSFRGLKTKIEAELLANTPQVVNTIEPVVTELIEEKKEEIIMQEPVKKEPKPKKPKVIGEVVEQTQKPKIIGEVVEYDVETDKKLIGE